MYLVHAAREKLGKRQHCISTSPLTTTMLICIFCVYTLGALVLRLCEHNFCYRDIAFLFLNGKEEKKLWSHRLFLFLVLAFLSLLLCHQTSPYFSAIFVHALLGRQRLATAGFCKVPSCTCRTRSLGEPDP